MTARWPFAMPAAWACVDMHGDGQLHAGPADLYVRLVRTNAAHCSVAAFAVIKDAAITRPFVDKYRAVMPFSFQLRT